MLAVKMYSHEGQPKEKIAIINGLRGMAIIGVLYTHLWQSNTPPGWHMFTLKGVHILPFAILSNMNQAVTLFFILSGFVLFLPYVSGKRSMLSFRDVVSFWRRRAIRLLPLYFVSVIITMIIVARPSSVRDLLLHLSLMFNLNAATFFPPHNPALWSIGLEWWVSILFPLLVFLTLRFRMSRVFVGIVLFSLSVRYISLWWPNYTPSGFNIVSNSLVGRLDDFVWGMALACICIKRRFLFHSLWIIPGVVLILAGCTVSDAVAMSYLPISYFPFVNFLIDLGFFLCVAGLMSSYNVMVRTLEFWPLQMAGLMSYSIYVWHFPLINIMHARTDLLHFVQYLLVLIPLSFLSYRFIEFPFVRNIRMLLPQGKHTHLSPFNLHEEDSFLDVIANHRIRIARVLS